MRHIISFLLCLPLCFGLGACAVGGNPEPMGRGYASYKDAYKSAPGANARSIGTTFEIEENKKMINDIRFAAADLVSKMEKNISFSAEKIFLIRTENSTFYNSFDHVLREEMVKSGFVISQNSSDSTPVRFVAQESPSASKNPSTDRPLLLALIVGEESAGHTSYVSGEYKVPTYEFSPSGPQNLHIQKSEEKYYPASLQRIIPED